MYLGEIEIVVLRCKGKHDFQSNASTVSSAEHSELMNEDMTPSDSGERSISKKSPIGKSNKSKKPEPEAEEGGIFGGMVGIFDGSADGPPPQGDAPADGYYGHYWQSQHEGPSRYGPQECPPYPAYSRPRYSYRPESPPIAHVRPQSPSPRSERRVHFDYGDGRGPQHGPYQSRYDGYPDRFDYYHSRPRYRDASPPGARDRYNDRALPPAYYYVYEAGRKSNSDHRGSHANGPPDVQPFPAAIYILPQSSTHAPPPPGTFVLPHGQPPPDAASSQSMPPIPPKIPVLPNAVPYPMQVMPHPLPPGAFAGSVPMWPPPGNIPLYQTQNPQNGPGGSPTGPGGFPNKQNNGNDSSNQNNNDAGWVNSGNGTQQFNGDWPNANSNQDNSQNNGWGNRDNGQSNTSGKADKDWAASGSGNANGNNNGDWSNNNNSGNNTGGNDNWTAGADNSEGGQGDWNNSGDNNNSGSGDWNDASNNKNDWNNNNSGDNNQKWDMNNDNNQQNENDWTGNNHNNGGGPNQESWDKPAVPSGPAPGWDNPTQTQTQRRNASSASNQFNGPLPDGRVLYGPHGAYYDARMLNPNAPAPDAQEEPKYDLPRQYSGFRGITKQVQPGPGYLYCKKRCAPAYTDSLEEPYARFVFKYRTKDQVEKETGIQIIAEPTGDEETNALENLNKEELIQMLIRAKGALGGTIPDAAPRTASQPVNDFQPLNIPAPIFDFLEYTLPPGRNTTNAGLGIRMSTAGGGGGDGGSGGNNNNHGNSSNNWLGNQDVNWSGNQGNTGGAQGWADNNPQQQQSNDNNNWNSGPNNQGWDGQQSRRPSNANQQNRNVSNGTVRNNGPPQTIHNPKNASPRSSGISPGTKMNGGVPPPAGIAWGDSGNVQGGQVTFDTDRTGPGSRPPSIPSPPHKNETWGGYDNGAAAGGQEANVKPKCGW
jgi:hypothetical protein